MHAILRLTTLPLLSALVAGCGPDGPFASLDTRCANLPPAQFEVVAVPVSFERDDTQSIAALTAKSGSALETTRTMGLTSAMFGQNTDIELHVIGDRRGARACGTPRVRVELSMQPMTVYVASELAIEPCQHDVTLSHEMKHVEVFREVLDESLRDLERDLPAAIGADLKRSTSGQDLQQRLVVGVRDYLAEFMKEHQRLLDERQAEVDSPEEYARVSAACAH